MAFKCKRCNLEFEEERRLENPQKSSWSEIQDIRLWKSRI